LRQEEEILNLKPNRLIKRKYKLLQTPMPTIKLIDIIPTIILTSICVIIVLIAYNITGVYYFQENSLFENSQVFVLLGIIITCIKGYQIRSTPKDIRQLFIFIAYIIFCLIGREISFGRVFYPLENGGFASSKDLPHLQSIRYVILFIGIFFVLYFIKNKLYKTIFKLLKKSTFYISDICFIVIFVIASMVSEKYLHNEKYEEIFESMLYLTALSISIKYCYNKNNILNL